MSSYEISEAGRQTRFAHWERLGLDRVKADLLNGGHQIVGGPPQVRDLAWEWVQMKEAEQRAASNQSSDILGEGGPLSPGFEDPLGAISPAATRRLGSDLTPPSAADKHQELFTLKPTLWGIGIDLREAWRRTRVWWQREKP
jgi:hypothetical protein